MLCPTDELAAIYPCAPDCSTRHGREIRDWHDPIRAVCRDKRCKRIEITREDALGYQVDLAKIGGAIAAALGAAPRPPSATPARRWWTIGALSRGAGAPLPVVLSTSVMPHETERDLAALIVHGLAPFMLAVPTARAVEASALAMLRRASCEVVILEEAIGVGERGLVAVASTPRFAAKPNVFRRDGKRRIICFADVTARVPETRGITHIGHLLSSPRKQIEAAELHRLAAGVKVEHSLTSGADIIDDEALAEIRARLDEIDRSIEEAREVENDERIAVLNEERREIARYVASAQGKNGRMRRKGDEGDRVRHTVYVAIDRALDALDVDHPDFARHFRRALQSTSTFAYVPEDGVAWEF
jgi:hypothetical protein